MKACQPLLGCIAAILFKNMKFAQTGCQMNLLWLLYENIVGHCVQFNMVKTTLADSQRRRRWACVIHRVVDSWLGMLPPSSRASGKVHAASCAGPLEGARVHATSTHAAAGTEVLARKPAKEERPILEPGGRGSLLQIERFTMCPLSLLPLCIIGG